MRARRVLLTGTIVVAALATASWPIAPRAAPPRIVGFVAETAGVHRGGIVRLGREVIGRVAVATQVDSLLRLEIALNESAPILQQGDQLRFVRGPTGFDWHVEVLTMANGAGPLGPGDVLGAAPSFDEADSTRHALDALPEITRGVQDGVRFLKRHPSLWSDSAR